MTYIFNFNQIAKCNRKTAAASTVLAFLGILGVDCIFAFRGLGLSIVPFFVGGLVLWGAALNAWANANRLACMGVGLAAVLATVITPLALGLSVAAAVAINTAALGLVCLFIASSNDYWGSFNDPHWL